jgi:hypothetical protein
LFSLASAKLEQDFILAKYLQEKFTLLLNFLEFQQQNTRFCDTQIAFLELNL